MREVSLNEAILLLRRGEILIYPTETVYGLGVDVANSEAIQKLFHLKQRDVNKPISILVSDIEQIRDCTSELSPAALKLIQKYFPGPLTLVLPASEKISPLLHGHSGWIGIRQSSHPVAQALVAGLGSPMTTTSANPSGQASALTVSDIVDYFSGNTDIGFLSGGDLQASQGSTVIKVEGDELILLREGDIPFSTIKDV